MSAPLQRVVAALTEPRLRKSMQAIIIGQEQRLLGEVLQFVLDEDERLDEALAELAELEEIHRAFVDDAAVVEKERVRVARAGGLRAAARFARVLGSRAPMHMTPIQAAAELSKVLQVEAAKIEAGIKVARFHPRKHA